MKKTILLIVIILLCGGGLQAQNFEKVFFTEGSEEDYYLALPPAGDKIGGVLVLLAGFGQRAESIFPESKLQNVAFVNGILTIAIAGGRKLYADNGVIERLNKAMEHVMSKFSVNRDQFIIGGYSAGGTISLRYAEYCVENGDEAPIVPCAVFTIDSPIDLFEIWDYFQREIERNHSRVGYTEAKVVSQIMIDEIGDPVNNEMTYNELTPFKVREKQLGNEQYLTDMSIRAYHDIDVAWQIENRRRSLYDSNSLPSSELINRLVVQGNEKAEFIMARNPGYRSNGMRHTHSWSIVDEVEFMQWMLGVLSDER